MNIKTLILARGGSKGIPRKNIIDINGKPLIQYSIEAAQASKANHVYVSTDCSAIMLEAIKHKANVIMRPSNISGDNSKSEDALTHFAKTISFDILVFIQPTSPLILPEDINKGLQMMSQFDSVFSAYKEHWIPRWSFDGEPDGWHTESRPMRQDMPEKWVENGAIYITKRECLEKSGLRYSGKIGILEMPQSRSFQIDTIDDLELIKKII
jgi:N-acylneuraminate cytidylyltransferase